MRYDIIFLTKTQTLGYMPPNIEVYELIARLNRIESELKGPDGFATWRDAAVAERIRRVHAEKRSIELAIKLEVDPRTKYDGIDCRDVTIRHLEEQIASSLHAQPHYVLRFQERLNGPMSDVFGLVLVSAWNAGMSRAIADLVCDSEKNPLIVYPTPLYNQNAEALGTEQMRSTDPASSITYLVLEVDSKNTQLAELEAKLALANQREAELRKIITAKNAATEQEPIAWIQTGGVFDEEIEDWDLEPNRKECEHLNTLYNGVSTVISLYAMPRNAEDIVQASLDTISNLIEAKRNTIMNDPSAKNALFDACALIKTVEVQSIIDTVRNK